MNKVITPTEAKKTLNQLKEAIEESKEESEILILLSKFEKTSGSFPESELTNLFNLLCDILKLKKKDLQKKALKVASSFKNIDLEKSIILNLITTFNHIKNDIKSDYTVCQYVINVYSDLKLVNWYFKESIPLFIFLFNEKNNWTSRDIYNLFNIYLKKEENILEFLKHEELIQAFVVFPKEGIKDHYHPYIYHINKCLKILLFHDSRTRQLILGKLKVSNPTWFKRYNNIFNFDTKEIIIHFHDQFETSFKSIS